MGFFNGTKDWEERLTLEDLDEMEKQGVDVKELREKLLKKQTEKNSNLEKLGETDLTKLHAYIKIPRDIKTEFFLDVVGKPFFFQKKKINNAYSNAELIFPMVMQASPLLYEPGDLSCAMVVLIWGKNIEHDELKTLRDLLADIRDGKVVVPKQLSEIVELLNDSKSMVEGSFNPNEIDSRFTNTIVRLKTIYVQQNKLPNKMIPNNEIIPCLKPEDDNLAINIIPGKWYSV